MSVLHTVLRLMIFWHLGKSSAITNDQHFPKNQTMNIIDFHRRLTKRRCLIGRAWAAETAALQADMVRTSAGLAHGLRNEIL